MQYLLEMLHPHTLAKFSVVALVAVQRTTDVQASSWIDCIDHNYDAVYTKSDDWVRGGTNGDGACEGYAYNYPGHGKDEHKMNDFSWKIDTSDPGAPLCQFKSSEAAYNKWRRAIHAKPGDKLFLGYMPNGHIAENEDGAGSVWGVYWSGTPGVELVKPSDLTEDKLVDEKLNGFDDGNCGFAHTSDGKPSGRAGDTKPCVGSLSIPTGTVPGRYQLVWYWAPSKLDDGSQYFSHTAYSTCFDVVVEAEGDVIGAALVKPANIADSNPEDRSDYTTQTTKQANKHHKRCEADDDATATTTAPPSKQQVPVPNETPVPTDAPKSTQTPSPVVTTTVSSVTSLTATPTATTTIAPKSAPTLAPTTASSPAPTSSFAPVTTASPSTTAPAIAAPSSVDSLSAPLATVTYNGVGGTGLYGKVTAMQCSDANTCSQTDFAVTGPVAPFDEDLTLALRGPLNVDSIAVFTSADTATWSQASSYSKQSGSSQNMVFLNNKGDPLKSGVFDTCNGNSQSYATADGKTAASSATQFSGVLEDGVEINVMSATSCAQSGTCGVTRGVAQQGWKGSNKIFMVKATMPAAPSGKDLPAIWLLNGQVVRTAQYGCNCRGKGDSGKWKGGCGELDVAEVIAGDHNALTSTIYSFKGSRGTNAYTLRPVDDAVVFVVIIAEATTTGSSDLGMTQVLVLKPEDVDMNSPPSHEQVQQWLAYRNGVQVDFDI